jgi:tripartite-type tricarboxylate transporter receptor subunit TctC
VARPDLGIDTLPQLIDHLKKNPGKLNYSTPGGGTLPHLAAELLKLRAGVDVVHVPFKGANPAAAALLSGTVELSSMSMSVALPQIKGGKAKALAVTGRERWSELPEVPSLAEAGYGDVVAETWQGFLAPAGTPPEAIERIARVMAEILKDPDIQEKFRQIGFGVTGKGPEALRDRIASELPKWKEVITKAGLKAD